MKRSTRLSVALTTVALVSLPAAGLGVGHRRAVTASVPDLAALPLSPAPALKIGRLEWLGSAAFVARWSIVREAAPARGRPETDAPVVADLALRSPEGTPNALQVLRSKSDAEGRIWVEVRLPMLPNGQVGWVERQFLGAYETVKTRLLVDREHLRATLYRGGKEVFTAPVGIGSSSWPTPAGEFMIRDELTRYKSPFYGPIAFGTTARSAVLTDWPEGGSIGIHGTDEPDLIPGRISHGCVRMRNADIRRLATLMPVGTPVTIT